MLDILVEMEIGTGFGGVFLVISYYHFWAAMIGGRERRNRIAKWRHVSRDMSDRRNTDMMPYVELKHTQYSQQFVLHDTYVVELLSSNIIQSISA